MRSGRRDDLDECRAGQLARVAAFDTDAFDADTAHDVRITSDRWSGAPHVYLGDLIAASRQGWADVDASPEPFGDEELGRRWEEAALETGVAVPAVAVDTSEGAPPG